VTRPRDVVVTRPRNVVVTRPRDGVVTRLTNVGRVETFVSSAKRPDRLWGTLFFYSVCTDSTFFGVKRPRREADN
jgi:hypothetical protein